MAPDDRQLVRECLRGDQDACTELVDRHARIVGTVIWRAVGRHDVVEDLAQETFLRVFRGLPAFDAHAKLSTWIFTIAHRVAIDHLRATGRRVQQFSAEEGADVLSQLPSARPTPEALLERRELEALLRAHVGLLPDKYRLPLVYAAIEGLEYATIAAMLGIPVGTVKTFVHRGKRLLRERIETACGLKTVP